MADDQVIQDSAKIVDAFKEMRDKMRLSQEYSGKGADTNKLYEAIREFAPAIGALPPCLPLPEPY
jgi:hypothetical protein